MLAGPPIVKADGTIETFDPNRLQASLVRAGARAYAAEQITEQIAKTVVAGASSREIYARAFTLLRKEARPVAARYALRRALLEFGPSGHPFEDFISHLFRANGWQVTTRQIMQGKCVAHEVDFYAIREGEHLAAELKYHNDPAYKTDLKIALYVHARFEDIWQCDPAYRSCPVNRGFLITNTKFTGDAIAYASCAGIELLGWSYPRGTGLLEEMCRTKVYPVTTLTTLSRSEKRLLIDQGIIAVDTLIKRPDALDVLRLSPPRVGEIRAEASELLALPHPFD
ncbi:hypothetical protein A3C95_01600 [Candidatus Kaiserbacteria bacterium RIFCSPHIGHO2_02_FULL_56_30]|uniref:ATP-cone domain-containing protein n=1 Tax=Candidatus Kaiserbacteria bacterium RIFCSPHIGHO2_02_FULL_56_30 TaxID=1798499 RepID=A0A1F6E591_9BACT|nr:MAG: hypothetical protein A3C95_01600 [Candidatus Kaiserbacteria bacterium RIFCSPHIGHO2_02_FULL_56_30]